ncbi:UpxY family transcription antiterminator [Balneolales bacterium ANBcel1]|nr:UpxY family transcription antiterminator [Balneolales bacterium ANBcel1]
MSLDAMEPKWYALYTRPKFEKKVEDRLREAGFDVWLPMQSVVRQWSDRKKKVEVPLFSSYVFVRTSQNNLYHAVQIDGVARTVGFNGAPAAIRDEQIEMIRKILAGPDAFEVEETDFFKGDPVEVVDGPLKGSEGVWVEWRGKKRVALRIEQLSQVLFVEVHAAFVKKLHNSDA